MKKISLFSAALAAALMFPIAGAAQQPAPQADARPREARSQRAARPQLTDAQREAMRALHTEQRGAAEAARKELVELHTQLSKELSAAQIDTGRVTEMKNQIAQKAAAQTAARIEQRAKVAALLTPEQRQAMGERGMRGFPGARGDRGVRRPGGMRGAHGAQMRRGAAGARGQMMRRGGPGQIDGQLRQRLEKLERELEELRKKIG